MCVSHELNYLDFAQHTSKMWNLFMQKDQFRSMLLIMYWLKKSGYQESQERTQFLNMDSFKIILCSLLALCVCASIAQRPISNVQNVSFIQHFKKKKNIKHPNECRSSNANKLKPQILCPLLTLINVINLFCAFFPSFNSMVIYIYAKTHQCELHAGKISPKKCIF